MQPTITTPPSSEPQKPAEPRFTDTAKNLALSNLLTLVVALIANWNLWQVLWIYWAQSVTIGFFNFQRMRRLKEFTSDGFRMNGRTVPPTPESKKQVANFFAMHYGLFHLAYLLFMTGHMTGLSAQDWIAISACSASFLVNHRSSARRTMDRDLARKPNIGTLLFFPYARIIPMHAAIIFGAAAVPGSRAALALFIVLKTAADLAMHAVQHYSKIDS